MSKTRKRQRNIRAKADHVTDCVFFPTNTSSNKRGYTQFVRGLIGSGFPCICFASGENSLWGGSFHQRSLPVPTPLPPRRSGGCARGNYRWIRWREWRRASPYLLPFPSDPAPASLRSEARSEAGFFPSGEKCSRRGVCPYLWTRAPVPLLLRHCADWVSRGSHMDLAEGLETIRSPPAFPRSSALSGRKPALQFFPLEWMPSVRSVVGPPLILRVVMLRPPLQELGCLSECRQAQNPLVTCFLWRAEAREAYANWWIWMHPINLSPLISPRLWESRLTQLRYGGLQDLSGTAMLQGGLHPSHSSSSWQRLRATPGSSVLLP